MSEIYEQDQGFDFLPVGMFHEVRDVNNAGSNNFFRHVCLLLLPYYSNYQRPEPLCDTAEGKLLVY